ncbi:hypothetical protein J6590_026700 [Homalodisca vitripennis]|nr:hypothetical protein J6590_026700 [Homalodisca vitripennis]
MVGTACVNIIKSLGLSVMIYDFMAMTEVLEWRKEKGSVKKKYISVEKELRSSPEWPPLSTEPPSGAGPEPLGRPERSPATVTMYTAFPFPPGTTSTPEPFMSTGDVPKRVRELSNGVATLPRYLPRAESQSCQSVVQVHQSEDSLSRYVTPPESPQHNFGSS